MDKSIRVTEAVWDALKRRAHDERISIRQLIERLMGIPEPPAQWAERNTHNRASLAGIGLPGMDERRRIEADEYSQAPLRKPK